MRERMRASLRVGALALWLAALAGCAARVPVMVAELTPLQDARLAPLVITAEVPVRLSTGYTRPIPAGSRWQAVGRLPQGEVFQPVGSVYAIEGRDIHEAYLVVRAGILQGFYLPGESRYSPLPSPIPLPLGATP